MSYRNSHKLHASASKQALATIFATLLRSVAGPCLNLLLLQGKHRRAGRTRTDTSWLGQFHARNSPKYGIFARMHVAGRNGDGAMPGNSAECPHITTRFAQPGE